MRFRYLVAIAFTLVPARGLAQPITLHLHQEAAANGTSSQLRLFGPDQGSALFPSVDLRNQLVHYREIRTFVSPAGEPGQAGQYAAGTTVSAVVWLRKSSSFGTLYPRIQVSLNSATGASLCSVTGTTPVTTTLASFTLTCAMPAPLEVQASDVIFVSAGVHVAAGPGNKSLIAELHVEGQLEGPTNSRLLIPRPFPPPPVITGLSPSVGAPGTPVTVEGQNFGATQGASVLKFIQVPAVSTMWTTSSILAPVPAGAATGPVTVTVEGQTSNGLIFTVTTPGAVSGTVTSGTGSPVAGATVELLRAGAIVASMSSAPGGGYAFSGLMSGVYDIRVAASGFLDHLRPGVLIGGATVVDLALQVPGSLTGVVSGVPGALSGAAITVRSSSAVVATLVTGAGGSYTTAQLPPGTYMVEAVATGHRAETQTVTIQAGGGATASFALAAAGSLPVRYAYDALGRLVGVTDQSGELARYAYDTVGNLLGIARAPAGGVAVLDVHPAIGQPGTAVRIVGTGFGGGIGDNAVRFNGTAAAVVSASPTELVVTVPVGATTGAVAVEAPSGTAVGPRPFTVAAAGPQIAGFTPAVAARGTAVTITGAGFAPLAGQNTVQLNVTQAPVTAVSIGEIQTVVPHVALSGPITVATAEGVARSADVLFVVPPEYNIANVGTTLKLSAGSNPYTLPGGKFGIFAFEGQAGQRVTLAFSTSAGCGTSQALYRTRDTIPQTDSSFFGDPATGSTNMFEGRYLPSTGTYTLIIEAWACANPTVGAIDLHYIPPDATYEITPDGPAVDVVTTAPGQDARLTFEGLAGQRVALSIQPIGVASCFRAIVALLPAFNVFNELTSVCFAGEFPVVTLPADGPYLVFVDYLDLNFGSMSVRLYSVPPDQQLSTTVNAPPLPIQFASPGQDAYVSFDPAGSPTVTVRVTGNTVGCMDVSVLDPSGGQLPGTFSCAGSFTLGPVATTAAGQHRVVVNPRDARIGAVSIQVTTP